MQWKKKHWTEGLNQCYQCVVLRTLFVAACCKNIKCDVIHGGGCVMVWGCGEVRGVEDLVNNDGIMNAKKYFQLVIHHAKQS